MGISPAQAAQAWVLRKPYVSSMLVGADTKAQLDSAVAALDTQLDDDALFELDRNYTPCDVINDYSAGKRVSRHARPAVGRFATQDPVPA